MSPFAAAAIRWDGDPPAAEPAPAVSPARSRLTVVPAPRSLPGPDPAPVPSALLPDPDPAEPTLPLLWAVPRPEPADPAVAPGVAGGAPPPPDLEVWVARLATGVLEVLHGTRPAGQLVRWFDPRVHRALAERAARVRPGPGGPPRVAVRSVHVSVRPPLRDEAVVVEAAAVVAVGPRCRAVALRLVPHAGRWRVTALEVG